MSLRDLVIQTEYHSLEEDVVRDFFIPVISESVRYDRAAGFFTSSGLAKQTVGISELVKRDGHIRLIASPRLSSEDIKAINEGYKLREDVIRESLLRELREPVDDFEAARLNLLSNLVASGVMDVKIAVLRDETGIFHDKFGILYDGNNNSIAFRGSMNETENAFYHNYESIDVYTSWNDYGRIATKEDTFERMWSGEDSTVDTVSNDEINKLIIEKYNNNEKVDLEIDLKQFGRNRRVHKSGWFINIPSNVKLREYQTKAIDKWEENGFRGIYDMATGTGKTITALGSLERFEKRHGDIFAIVVCPYKHLVNQWAEDVEDWGLTPIICHSESPLKNWQESVASAFRRYLEDKRSFICLITNRSFTDKRFQKILGMVTPEMNVVLVADEVHNFGADYLSKTLPQQVTYRLGLSATVERYMDEKGTNAIFDYFGNKCIEYPLERAIAEHALVPYEYYPIIVCLTPNELNAYNELSKLIARSLKEENGKMVLTEAGKMLMYKRTRLVAGAENKLDELRKQIEPYRYDKHILVYCGATKGLEDENATNERQIDRVEKIIGNEFEMSTHRFTAEEDDERRRLIKEGFADGDYQVITAIKCLDEGVNIPNIQTAFILASSRNPKEFIQRRGRVLRKADGKDKAVIYDFVTLPRELNEIRFGDYENDRPQVLGELARIHEFGIHSLNTRIADQMIDDIQEAYGIDISEEEYTDNKEGDLYVN